MSAYGGYGLYGKSSAIHGYGLYGKSSAIHGYGLYGKSDDGFGVRGEGLYYGVSGTGDALSGTGVSGEGYYGVRGSNGGSNTNGNVTTDAAGFATVTLPDWFEALNRDFRYQLTVVGQFAQAMVAEEIKDNQFRIQTDRPGVKVSWQVTGIRHDPFAEAYRIPVEEKKTGDELGRYLYPDVYGKSVQESIWYASSPNVSYMIDHREARERLDADAPLPDPASLEQPPGQ